MSTVNKWRGGYFGVKQIFSCLYSVFYEGRDISMMVALASFQFVNEQITFITPTNFIFDSKRSIQPPKIEMLLEIIFIASW